MSCSQDRLIRLRSVLDENGLDAMYLRDLSNIAWLTAFDGVFDSEPAHALIVTQDQVILHTDSRYALAASRAAEGTSIEIDSRNEPHSKVLQEHLECFNRPFNTPGEQAPDKASGRFRLGLESTITLGEYRRLEKRFSALADRWSMQETEGLVLSLREIKDAEEIKRLRAAQAITDAAFTHIVSFIKPGMSEREVQLELEAFMLAKGAEGLAFSSIVAVGANGANPHAIAGDTRLEAGQSLVLDFGARVQGYCSDMTRTVFIGQPSQNMVDAYNTIRRANEEVSAFLKPGVSGADAHILAEDILKEGGFEGKMGHALGHGLGIDIHEEPRLSSRNTHILVEGNVVTVEPGIYIPGEFGMRLEDFGVIVSAGFELITQSKHDMVII